VLRSTKRRPVRCASCGEFAFLPAVASVPFSVFVELAIVLALVLAAWLSGWWLFFVALFGAVAVIALVAFAWPLSKLPARTGAVSVSRPSGFYSGNP
jgi:uncharacterized membrane protein